MQNTSHGNAIKKVDECLHWWLHPINNAACLALVFLGMVWEMMTFFVNYWRQTGPIHVGATYYIIQTRRYIPIYQYFTWREIFLWATFAKTINVTNAYPILATRKPRIWVNIVNISRSSGKYPDSRIYLTISWW